MNDDSKVVSGRSTVGRAGLTLCLVCFASRSSGLPPSTECFLLRLLKRFCIVRDFMEQLCLICKC